MDFYKPHDADPDWLRFTARFHGHLGPWLVLGAMVGQDALKRLESPGQWLIDVTCHLPEDRQRTPFTCLLDGLQATSGATMGKCNLHMTWQPARFGEAWPAVAVGVPRQGGVDRELLYRPRPALQAFMRQVDPQRLEAQSRELAAMAVDALFEIADTTAGTIRGQAC